MPSGVKNFEGIEFRKLEFGLPKIRGAAGQWRLMYFLRLADNAIFLFWVYSHGQYPKRPNPQELGLEIEFGLEEITKS